VSLPVVCGTKLTHDGGVAVIEDGRLAFCIEVEKTANRPRHSELADLDLLEELLASEGVSLPDLDGVAVDGWIRFADGVPVVEVRSRGTRHEIPVAGYDERRDPRAGGRPMTAVRGELPAAGGAIGYRSYPHATGHLLSAYCTSPFAPAGQASLVLVWDGGMPATLYLADPVARSVRALGVVLDITGALYPTFAACLPLFELPPSADPEAYLPVSGKAMAYAGTGRADEAGVAECARVFGQYGRTLHRSAGARWSREVIAALREMGLSDADMIACMQEFVGQELVSGLRDRIAELDGPGTGALCFAGGCALNIKWNARLRACGMFSDVWVPPFPNDSGSAIGTACAEMITRGGAMALEWDVFRGPRLPSGEPPLPGWTAAPASIADVAGLLHETGEPVVVLTGRAELGPRALGHRSILASAACASTRDRLNAVKQREWYRPVAPICLEDAAGQVFDPGSRDPYMLFDHLVRPGWTDAIPAVVHADGSARLQTIDDRADPVIAALLREYRARSQSPVLCNTSANLKGRGFFPDAASAMRWGGTGLVWSDGLLYRRLADGT
jgi:carbamoyltransferase